MRPGPRIPTFELRTFVAASRRPIDERDSSGDWRSLARAFLTRFAPTRASLLPHSTTAQGFENYPRNFTDDFEYVSAPIEEENPNCIVVPLSRLTVNETGVKEGDFSSFSVSLFVSR